MLNQAISELDKFLEDHENVEMDDPMFLLVAYAEGMRAALRKVASETKKKI